MSHLSLGVGQKDTNKTLGFMKEMDGLFDNPDFVSSIVDTAANQGFARRLIVPFSIPRSLGASSIEAVRDATHNQSYVAHTLTLAALTGTLRVFENTLGGLDIAEASIVVRNKDTVRTIATAALQTGQNFNRMSRDPDAFVLDTGSDSIRLVNTVRAQVLRERFDRREQNQDIGEERSCPYSHMPVFARPVANAATLYLAAREQGLQSSPSLLGQALQAFRHTA